MVIWETSRHQALLQKLGLFLSAKKCVVGMVRSRGRAYFKGMIKTRGGPSASGKKQTLPNANQQHDMDMDITLQSFNAKSMEPLHSANHSGYRSGSANIAGARTQSEVMIVWIIGAKVLALDC